MNVAAGSFYYLRWSSADAGGSGSRDEIGIDDINVTASYGSSIPTVNLSISAPSGSESASTYFTLTATASPAVSGDQTVDLSLSGGGLTNGDFRLDPDGPGPIPPSAITFPYTLTIPDGQTTSSVTLMVFDDALNEGLETATFTIDNESTGITLGSTTTQDFDITDNDSPVIVVSPTSLTGFSTTQGTPSAAQTFTVSGDNLSGDLSIAAVTGYEYSLDNSSFSTTLTVPVSGGNVIGEPRTVYVRLTGASVGSPAGNATVSGGGASDQNVALSGTVSPFSPVMVINKFSADGLIELLVVNNNADIRGLILKDFPGGADVGGNLVFASTGAGGTLWSSVPAGTLIVIDLNDANTEDVSHADGDFTIWVGGQNITYFSSSTLAMIDMGNTMLMLKSGTTGGVAQNIHTVSCMGPNALYTSIGSGYKQQISASINQGVYNRNLQSAVQNFNTNAQLLTFNVVDPDVPTWAMGSTVENSVFICGLRGGNAEPTASATGINFTAVTETGFTVNWTSPVSGGGANRLVVVRPTAASVEHPSDGFDYYVPSTDFSNPDPFDGTTGTDNVVVYRGSGSSVTVTGLSANTSYTASIYEFNGVTFCADFLTPGHSGAQTTLAPVTPCSELFISEYVEGSGTTNKYIEIYNPTSSAVDLAAGLYSMHLYSNGAGSPSQSSNLSGTIPAYGTRVYKNGGTLYGGPATTDAAVVNFSGDDAVVLAKNGTSIDIFGVIDDDPGTAWTLGGNTTLNKTLVRNPEVQAGVNVNPTGIGPGAFVTLGSEWTQLDIDVVDSLGSHTCDCFVPNPEATISINTTTGTEDDETSITLTISTDVLVTGEQTVQVTLGGDAGVTNGDFTGVTFPITVTIPDGEDEATFTFTVNDDADVEGDETATFTIGSPSSGINIGTPSSVDLDIDDNDNLTSNESVVISQGGESATIPSLANGTITTNTDGVQVWHFRLYDGDGSSNDADDKPTRYSGFTIRPAASNTVPDWDAAIADVKFFQNAEVTPIFGGGVLMSASTISFSIPSAANHITVTDHSFVDIYMHLTLENTLPNGSDGQHFAFSIDDSDVSVNTDALTYSQLGTFTANSDAADNEIDILATLQFIDVPTTVSVGSNFSITVSAIDVNGNVDTDVTSSITLTQTGGSGTLSGTTTANLVNGTYTFSGLNHDTEELIEVTASGGSYSSVSANVNVVDQPYQLFDDFNRPNSNTVGVPSSETSVTYSEDDTGNGTRTRIEDNQLLLTNCNNGSGTGGSEGMEEVMFNIENRYETVFDNAASTLEWYFNISQSRPDGSGFDANNFAAAVILGSDQLTQDALGADGYAVTLGNAGNDQIRLVRFTNGLTSNTNLSVIAQTGHVDADSHFSVKVTYNPCDGEWSLSARDDGGSFAAPNAGGLDTVFTGTDQTHTSLDLRYFGMIWNHNTSCTETATFDNVSIPNAGPASTTAKEWNGNVNANWNEPNNWGPCPGVPTITDNVVIPNVTPYPVVSSAPAAVCNTLTVNSDAELTINSGQSLTADDDVTNNGVIRVMDSGNFIQTTNSTTHAGSGNMVVQRQGSASTTVYNYWSSPVVNGSLPGGNQYYYDSSLGTHSNTDDTPADLGWQSFSGNMTPGQGYASTGGGLATFTGVPNNSDVDFGVTTSAQPMNSLVGGTRFNLVGNPYPSAISANAFINANGPSGTGRIAGVLYFWADDNSGGSGYATEDYAVFSTIGSISTGPGGGTTNPNGFISSGQGFKVDATSDGDVTFTNAMRGGDNTQFFRLADEDETMDRLWLSLSGNGLFNQTLIAFRDDATDLRDVMYDAYKIQGNSGIALASVQAGETFAIAAYPTITQPRTVPLHTFVSQQGSYTFEADSLNGFADTDVYLQDLHSGQSYLLVQGSTVTVSMDSQDAFNRFQLWMSPQLITGLEDADEHSARIISSEMGLQVLMAEGVNTNGELRLHNAMGQLVMSQQVGVNDGRSSLLDVSGLPAGIYIAAFRSAEGMVNAKVVLR